MTDQPAPTPEAEKPDPFFDERAWRIGALGDLLKTIADYGNQDYFIYRIKDMKHEGKAPSFVRHLEVFSVPITEMPAMLQTLKPKQITSTADALLTHYGVLPNRRPVSSEVPGGKIDAEDQVP